MDNNKRDDSHCWRCGEMCFLWERAFVLSGDYHCILCPQCRNDADEFLRENVTQIEFTALQDRLASTGWLTLHDGDQRLEQVAEIRTQERELTAKLRIISETWVNDRIEREQPEAPPPPTPEELKEQRNRYMPPKVPTT